MTHLIPFIQVPVLFWRMVCSTWLGLAKDPASAAKRQLVMCLGFITGHIEVSIVVSLVYIGSFNRGNNTICFCCLKMCCLHRGENSLFTTIQRIAVAVWRGSHSHLLLLLTLKARAFDQSHHPRDMKQTINCKHYQTTPTLLTSNAFECYDDSVTAA